MLKGDRSLLPQPEFVFGLHLAWRYEPVGGLAHVVALETSPS